MIPRLTRRKFVEMAAVASTAPLWAIAPSLAADQAIDLRWSDLVPEEQGMAMEALRELGIVQHGQLTTPFDQETGGKVTDAFNDRLVRIPGYLVPLDFDGTGVTAAILVPYVGACIHVPPPPPNQLIFVTAQSPYESQGLFEPVYVTGMFGTSATATQLAEIGYAISSGRIEPYG